jgi:RecJ-like exonuclease
MAFRGVLMARHAAVIPLVRCEVCQGRGTIKGIFHVMECAGCNGGGLFDQSTGQALSHQQLVQQLRILLDRAARQVEQQQKQLERAGLVPVTGPAADYQGNNKKGAHGAHLTGD